MATQLKKVVAPSGGDYTSLEACMNANEQNLVTADKYFDVEISGTWSSADTTSVTIHIYTTDDTHYINIYTTGDARHDGRAASVSGRSNHLISVGGADGITSTVNYVTLNGLEVYFGASDYTFRNGIILTTTGGIADSCIVHGKTGTRSRGIYGGAVAKNCIVYNISSVEAVGTGIRGVTVVNGCTVYGVNSTSATYSAFADGTVKNCIGMNNGSYNFTVSDSYNMSDDASATGTGSLTNKTASNQFVSAGTDFTLKAGADAINAGTDLGSPYNADIVGTARPQGAAWDIGAFEYVGAATTVKPRLMLMGVGV